MDFSRESAEMLHQVICMIYGLDAEDDLHRNDKRAEAIAEMNKYLASTWNDGYNCGYAEGRSEY